MTKSETVLEALREMFRRVGFEADVEEYCKQEDWFLTKSWTVEEQADFKKWYVELLRKRYHMSKRFAERQAEWFVLNWGWTTNAK